MTVMKNYRISRKNALCFLTGLVGLLAYDCFSVWVLFHLGIKWNTGLPAVIGLIGTAALLYVCFFDFPFGTFSFNERGISMRYGFRERHHGWEQFSDAGTVEVQPAGHGGFGPTYFIFFSERALSPEERRVFLSKTRRGLKHVAFFQYDAKVLRKLLPLLPPELSERIRESERWVVPQKLRDKAR